nr:MAG TPA: hypothetical protein [Caudoviricetes sp.]
MTYPDFVGSIPPPPFKLIRFVNRANRHFYPR